MIMHRVPNQANPLHDHAKGLPDGQANQANTDVIIKLSFALPEHLSKKTGSGKGLPEPQANQANT